MSFRYLLRYSIDPGFEAEARLEELRRFCLEASVEEVMLFIGAEELSTGFPDEEELEAYLRLFSLAKRVLGAEGVELSLNPWFTLYCVPRGRRQRSEHGFRLMVGENGARSPIVACPLCERWQEYLCTTFARIAREIEPVAIWIEDDWRLHNHGGDLGWGGCFCDEHLQRFANGRAITREGLLAALLQPGPPHPWREEWLALSRASLLEPLDRLKRAVYVASPSTELGLMSSMPDQHSIEGRDWGAIGRILSSDGHRFLLRPHLRPYTEEWMVRVPPSILRQTLECAPQATFYPELENSPRSGIYSKSASVTRLQMYEAAVLGAPGITLNHFDMMGNGISLDPRFGTLLKSSKPMLNALHSLALRSEEACGVEVLFSPQIAGVLHLNGMEGASSALALAMQDPSQAGNVEADGGMNRLAHPSLIWGEACAILGIPHRYTSRVGDGEAAVLVSGQTLRAFERSEVERLLGGRVVLDGEALSILLEWGYGSEVGARVAAWRSLQESGFSFEEWEKGGVRMSAQRCAERMLAIEPLSGAEVVSWICNGARERLWPGCYRYVNQRGGEITVLAYPLDGKAQYFMGFFNPFRQRMLRELFASEYWVACDALRCYQYQRGEDELIAVVNPTSDGLEAIRFFAPQETVKRGWSVLTQEGGWRPLSSTREEGYLVLEYPISAHGVAVFRAQTYSG